MGGGGWSQNSYYIVLNLERSCSDRQYCATSKVLNASNSVDSKLCSLDLYIQSIVLVNPMWLLANERRDQQY